MPEPELVAVAATEERYRALKHVPSGLGFNADGKGTWPADQFTYRLVAEGAVRIATPAAIDPVQPLAAGEPDIMEG